MSGSEGFQIRTASSELKIGSGTTLFKRLLTQRLKKMFCYTILSKILSISECQKLLIYVKKMETEKGPL